MKQIGWIVVLSILLLWNPQEVNADVPVVKMLTFEDLGYVEDIEVTGISQNMKYRFALPKSWSGVSLSLNLRYSYSNLLSARLSHMTVVFNDIPLKSVQLDGDSTFGNNLEVLIPAEIIEGNQQQLTIRFFMRMFEEQCQDSGQQPGLWSVIHRDSTLTIGATETDHDLAWFPEPFTPYNLREADDSRLTVVLPPDPTSPEIQAATRVLAKLGQQVGFHNIEPRVSLGELPPQGDVIVVARGARIQPIIDTSGLPIYWNETHFVHAATGNPIHNDDGTIQLLTREDQSGLLIITGNGPTALARASAALADDSSLDLMSGDHAIIRALPQPAFPPPTVPEYGTLKHFTGLNDIRIEGIVIEEAKYCFFLPLERDVLDGAVLELTYHHSLALWPERSSMEVRFNEKTFASASLNHEDGTGRLTINLPNSFFEDGFNCFEFEFTLRMEATDCNVGFSSEAWASISAESSFLHVPMSDTRQTPWMPDMGQYTYPFNLDEDLKNTWIVLPDAPRPAEIAGAMRLAMRLGADAAHTQLRLHAGIGAELVPDQYKDSHIVLIGHPARNTVARELDTTLRLDANNEATLKLRTQLLLQQINGAASATAEMLSSPWDERRAVLWLNGTSGEALNQLFVLLHTNPNEETLSGNIISITPDGVVGTVDTFIRDEFLEAPEITEDGQVVQTEIEEPAAIRGFVTAAGSTLTFIVVGITLAALVRMMRRRGAQGQVEQTRTKVDSSAYSAEDQHEIAMIAIRQEMGEQQICEQYGVTPLQLDSWRRRALQQMLGISMPMPEPITPQTPIAPMLTVAAPAADPDLPLERRPPLRRPTYVHHSPPTTSGSEPIATTAPALQVNGNHLTADNGTVLKIAPNLDPDYVEDTLTFHDPEIDRLRAQMAHIKLDDMPLDAPDEQLSQPVLNSVPTHEEQA